MKATQSISLWASRASTTSARASIATPVPRDRTAQARGATCALLDFEFTCAFYDGITCVPDSATSTRPARAESF